MDESTLDKIAKLICGNGEHYPVYRSSSYLTAFFARAGLPRFVHDGSTRQRWVLEGSNLDNIGEWSGFVPGSQLRSKGTALASSKRISVVPSNSPLRHGKRLFVVVTHQVEGWAKDLVDAQESYALVVALESRGGENVRLYTQIRTRLRQRARARG